MRINLKTLEALNELVDMQKKEPNKVYVDEDEICLIWEKDNGKRN